MKLNTQDYKGYYINLEKDTTRKESIENQLNRFSFHNYERFEAINGSHLKAKYPKLDNGSLGCAFSHIEILKQNLESNTHLHILEDDAILHKSMPQVFEALHTQVEWDIIYTDIYFSFLAPEFFYQLNAIYKNKQEPSLINLKKINFSAATSYFINKKSIKKLYTLLNDDWDKDIKHDDFINNLVQNGRLNAFVIFPFISTLSSHSQDSTINEKYSSNLLAIDALRKSFYIDADESTIENNLIEFLKDLEVNPMLDIYADYLKIILHNLETKQDFKQGEN